MPLALVGDVGEVAELLQWLPAESARELIPKESLHTQVPKSSPNCSATCTERPLTRPQRPVGSIRRESHR